jgi:hemoglobin
MTDSPSPSVDLQEGDLHEVLVTFYARLGEDDLLSSFFEQLDMAEHIPRIEAFWSTIVFGSRRYSDNAFAPHQRLDGLTADHFVRWVGTLESVLDVRFRGPATERMKAAAHRIAYSMQLRLGIPPFRSYF